MLNKKNPPLAGVCHLANWAVPNRPLLDVGDAMDLAGFQFSSGRPVLTALIPDVTVEQVRLNTDFTFETDL